MDALFGTLSRAKNQASRVALDTIIQTEVPEALDPDDEDSNRLQLARTGMRHSVARDSQKDQKSFIGKKDPSKISHSSNIRLS